ncbi:EAL domain-containing protein [Aurantimonas aggregata]|uniref:EAL domain-containing protein n=1 Tax=Aurantimonas aggregata TaxID=2047720 RepID=A0A6L9MIR4_9HYPH|nr:EAL domain-containing protein [Aurantimonas aggregata]NDV87715.1 EAL domain-containing protein [Aurantimonas aggregata]
MQTVLTCLQELHDPRLLTLAGFVCLVGVYASFSIAQHAGRSKGTHQRNWVVVSIVAAGCTAWATHMIALLAFRPGMPAAFEPVLMTLSLLAAIVGIALGMLMSIGRRGRLRRFRAGVVIGLGIVALHYIGQASYVVRGHVAFDPGMVAGSIAVSLIVFGAAVVVAGERSQGLRPLGVPLLILAIALLHIGGMSALQLTFDPLVALPAHSLSPAVVAPIVGAVAFSLVVLALFGLRFAIAAAARHRRDRQRLHELANIALEGLTICDDGVIVTANDSLAKLSGYTAGDLVGRPVAELLPDLAIADLADREEVEASLHGANGVVVPVRVLQSVVTLGTRPQTVLAFRDQRERLRTESRLRKLAFFDPLTGLPNRPRFVDLLDERAKTCRHDRRPFAVLAIDIDRFKWVNDTLGHVVGDALLRRVGSRLGAVAKGASLAGRLGADEFALLVEGGAGSAEAAVRDVVELLSRPFLIDGRAIDITASVGIVIAPEDGADAEALTHNADLALSGAKGDGGNRHRFFEPAMNEEARQRQILETELRQVLARGELVAHYQPQTDPRTGLFQGAEALVRWNHPERGMVPPDHFIPLAEEIGLIGAVGEWVLHTACTEACNWADDLSVAVNLSPMQLRDRNLAATVLAIVEASGLAAHRLELEITESAIIADDETTYGNLRTLQAAGIRISMDDFGTGYSSLSYLRRFPFDKLKIDRSFVQNIPEDRDSVAIVEAVAMLGRRLGMTVTMEGVETEAQRAFAATQGCDQIQGYLISRPVPAAVIRAMFSVTLPHGLTA